jgi:hypothetical protein
MYQSSSVSSNSREWNLPASVGTYLHMMYIWRICIDTRSILYAMSFDSFCFYWIRVYLHGMGRTPKPGAYIRTQDMSFWLYFSCNREGHLSPVVWLRYQWHPLDGQPLPKRPAHSPSRQPSMDGRPTICMPRTWVAAGWATCCTALTRLPPPYLGRQDRTTVRSHFPILVAWGFFLKTKQTKTKYEYTPYNLLCQVKI